MLQSASTFLAQGINDVDVLAFKTPSGFNFYCSNVNLPQFVSVFAYHIKPLHCLMYHFRDPLFSPEYKIERINETILRLEGEEFLKIAKYFADRDISFAGFEKPLSDDTIIDIVNQKEKRFGIKSEYEKMAFSKNKNGAQMAFASEELFTRAFSFFLRSVVHQVVGANVSYANLKVIEKMFHYVEGAGFHFSLDKDLVKKTKTYEISIHPGTHMWRDFVSKKDTTPIDKMILYYDRTSGIWELIL